MLTLAHIGRPLAPRDVWTAWSFEPVAVLSIAVAWWLFRRGSSGSTRDSRLFAAGLVVAGLAVISPIDAMGSVLASAHMVQHLLLMMVSVPLIALARPGESLLLGMPRRARKQLGKQRRRLRLTPALTRRLSHPSLVWAVLAGVLWFWHLPGPYESALGNDLVHVVEHSTFILAAVAFWAMVFGAPSHLRGLAVLAVFTAALQSTLLAALLTFAPTPWYSSYEATAPIWGLTPIEDQQLAGVIMWVPGGLVYLAAGLAVFASWIGLSGRQFAAAPGGPSRHRVNPPGRADERRDR